MKASPLSSAKNRSGAIKAPEEPPKGALVQPPLPDTGMVMGSAPSGTRVRTYNRWRERYNPLRGLNISRAVALLEQYQRGEMADPQWVYFFIEQSDADLFAILERREAALLELNWKVSPLSGRWTKDDPRQAAWDKGLAAEQTAALLEAYDGIDNLYEAISHLQLATFRGFSHLEKWRSGDGDIYHLELVDQWNVVRDLLRGQWKYNPRADSTTFAALGEDMLIDPADFIIRERDRHVNRLALVKFIRQSLSEKDWDAFIEIYGLPSGVIVGPPNVPPEKEASYRESAQNIAEGGSGYLPNGSTYTANDSPRGNSPFRPRLDYLSEKLVLAGTGGLLTMLTAPTGIGKGPTDAHADAFKSLARAEARKISELFNRSIDTEFLDKQFPGKPALVYFEIAANDELDAGEVVAHAVALAGASFRVSPEQLAEKTGYEITLADPAKVTVREDATPGADPTEPPPADDPANPEKPPITNRAKTDAAPVPVEQSHDFRKFLARMRNRMAGATAEDLKPLRAALAKALQGDDAGLPDRLKALNRELPAMADKIITAKASSAELYEILSAALASQVGAGAAVKNRSKTAQPRHESGQFLPFNPTPANLPDSVSLYRFLEAQGMQTLADRLKALIDQVIEKQGLNATEVYATVEDRS
jgi:phage gp29-like protein